MSDQELALHHNIVGDIDDDGTPVVFTAGWLNTGEVWAATIEALAGEARTLTWDKRGHGRSQAAAPGRYRRADALSDLGRMIELAGSPAILVGHSLGGYLSLAKAILSPDQVCGLVLVAAGPGFRNPDSRQEWNDSVRSMADAKRAAVPEGMEELSMHVDAMVIDRLSEIRVPAITIVGERDTRFRASADVFDKYLSVEERIEVPDAGHMVHAKNGVVVADAVRKMIALVG